MIPAWMLYATAVGCIAVAGALALERLFGIWRLPRRMVWVAAMLITAVVPLRLATRSASRQVFERSVAARPTLARTASASAARRSVQVPWRIRIYRWSARVDGRARTAWLIGSSIVAAGFALAYASMARRRATWREGTVLGHSVLLTTNVGPAVVGFIRPRIVLPDWAVELPAPERRLMLAHELEHLTGNDPKLLLLAGALLILFPWNAPLWWMTRRLRLAIEIDCDARVIDATGAPDEYGLFLVAVGERRTHGLLLAASLAERRSSLEQRINAMTMPRPRHPIFASLPFAILALGAVTVAAQTPTPPAVARAGGVLRPMATEEATRIRLTNDQVRALIASHVPAVATGKSDDNMVTLVLASNGDFVIGGSTQIEMAEPSVAVGRLQEVPASTLSPSERAATERVAVATMAAAGQVTPASQFVTIPGIGDIDRSLMKDNYFATYNAGEVSAGAIRVRVITLRGNAVK